MGAVVRSPQGGESPGQLGETRDRWGSPKTGGVDQEQLGPPGIGGTYQGQVGLTRDR